MARGSRGRQNRKNILDEIIGDYSMAGSRHVSAPREILDWIILLFHLELMFYLTGKQNNSPNSLLFEF